MASNADWLSHFTAKTRPDGIDNTLNENKQNNVKKLLQNGQLLIIKDGTLYNAAGQIVGQSSNSDKF